MPRPARCSVRSSRRSSGQWRQLRVILHLVRLRNPGRRRSSRESQQPSNRSSRIFRGYEMLSNQKGIGTGCKQPLDVLSTMDSTLNDKESIVRNLFSKPNGSLKINIECFQIAIVHADDLSSRLQSL